VVRLPAGVRAGPLGSVSNAPAGAVPREAWQVTVRGLVQGVGFRPFVYRLAARHGLVGWVRNQSGEVAIAAEGDPAALRAFVDALRDEAPPLARIAAVETAPGRVTHGAAFTIIESEVQPARRQPIAPDVALCPECEAELADPRNRRHRYPFITCTTCGPRFTVIEAMPYDRARTSMRAFTQCAACLAEYTDPTDRRYHSETNSCGACGPGLWLVEPGRPGERVAGEQALRAAADRLLAGDIVALRGLGGFHLAVDATNDAAVRRLRERKSREAKPLAVMVRTVADASRLGSVGAEEERLLRSRERPIVLLDRRPDASLAAAVAPGLTSVGVMTAYTPLHHLLLALVDRPLVMTSGNASDEPIATGNDEALACLGTIADAFLLHDREITARYDDSVVRLIDGAPIFLRRARGYAPLPLALPVPSPVPFVAVGPHLKNTFALVQGSEAWVSQHIGDLDNLETLEHFRTALDAYSRLFHIEPELAVRDRHPGYLSSRVAAELGLPRVLDVQHHVAHVAAVLAEHGRSGPAIGVAFDGTGYGDDGHVWGAEVFVASLTAAERVAQLRYAPLPGGDLAARTPWRVALGYRALGAAALPAFDAAFTGVAPDERAIAERQISRQINAPLASSMGRLFDAAAAVLGVRRSTHYEGQAPMELEALAGRAPAEPLPFPITEEAGGYLVMEPLPLLMALDERRRAGDSVATLAARFHESVAATAAAVVRRVAERTGVVTVALGGGVFQNARLLSSLGRRLEADGLEVLRPRHLSPNDGAISFGQAAIAAALLQAERGG
jgi:hydrogenase maturation protein HypF